MIYALLAAVLVAAGSFLWSRARNARADVRVANAHAAASLAEYGREKAERERDAAQARAAELEQVVAARDGEIAVLDEQLAQIRAALRRYETGAEAFDRVFGRQG